MRVLIVKLTSMGDLVHALPAITDASRAIPHITFDWVIDDAFAEVAQWHPQVNRIIRSNHRRWKQNWFEHWRNGELKQFLHELRHTHYDIMIDAQNNMKSALISRLSRATSRCGMDKNSVRERAATLAYHKKFAIPKHMHAITRLRHLFAQALEYDCPTTPAEFSIDPQTMLLPNIALPERYLVFVHNVSWESKGWPEIYWRELIALANQANFSILLPWGTEAERERALRLTKNQMDASVLPHLSLTAIAAILHHSQGAICMDTGLSHIAAALGVPAVTLYGSTDPFLIGTTGRHQVRMPVQFACAPCYRKKCNYEGDSLHRPACFVQHTTEKD